MNKPLSIVLPLVNIQNEAYIIDKEFDDCAGSPIAKRILANVAELEKEIDKLLEVYDTYNIIVSKAKIKQTGRRSYVLKCPLNFDETTKVVNTCKYYIKKEDCDAN